MYRSSHKVLLQFRTLAETQISRVPVDTHTVVLATLIGLYDSAQFSVSSRLIIDRTFPADGR